MPKISGLPTDTAPTTDDYVPSLDNGTSTLKKSTWATIIAMIFGNAPTASLSRAAIDWSTFSNNIKSASNGSALGLTNGVVSDLGSSGAQVSFTLSGPAYAFVTVNVGVTSTTDFEEQPQIFVDGVGTASGGYSANLGGGAGGRSMVRPYTRNVTLTTGTHTISAGIFVNSATSPNVAIGNANITVIVFGNVTA